MGPHGACHAPLDNPGNKQMVCVASCCIQRLPYVVSWLDYPTTKKRGFSPFVTPRHEGVGLFLFFWFMLFALVGSCHYVQGRQGRPEKDRPLLTPQTDMDHGGIGRRWSDGSSDGFTR